jgi:hypothetical protein
MGNLTLSAFNSYHINRSFNDKQNLEKKIIYNQELKIGYKNGLGLNQFEFMINDQKLNLFNTDDWKKEHLSACTLNMFHKIFDFLNFS